MGRTIIMIGIAAMLSLAIGAGAAFMPPARPAATAEPAAAAGPAAQREHPLPAIVTNLASPPGAFVRLQAALVLDEKAGSFSAAAIGDDILAYLRTLSIEELRGSSGLINLRDDLSDRARIRSGGAVRRIALHELVVQ